ncbi:MAG: hypothetical protein MI724_08695, partial [Spirochaetales bacterium]|nr:hypothetical protein [Spirochaetales bacterium]
MNATGSWIKRNEGYLYILPAFLLVSVFGIYPILYTVFVSLHRWRIRRGNFVGFANYRTIFGEWGPFLLLVGAILAVIWSLRLRERSVDAVDDLSRLSGEGRFARMSSTQRRRYVGHLLTLAGGIVLLFLSLPMLHAAGDERMFDSLRVTIWYSLGAVPVQLAGGLFIAWFLNNKFKGRQLFRVLFLTPYIVPTVAGAAIFERLFSIRPESFANQVLMAIGGDPQDWLQEVRGVFDIIFGFG